MSGSANDPLALAKVRKAVEDLAVEVRRGVRQRKLFFLSQLAQWVAIIVLLVLLISMLLHRGDSRAYYNQQITRLACAEAQYRPAGDPLGDQLRRQFVCPASGQRSGGSAP